LTGVTVHNGRLVAVGSIPPRIGAWSSSDGIEWIDMPTNGPVMGSRSALLLHDGVLVSVGSGPSGARAWASTDGRAWLEGMNLPDGTGGRAHDVASIGDDIVAVGAAGSAGAIWWGSEVTR
jgi:hypothetical protein